MCSRCELGETGKQQPESKAEDADHVDLDKRVAGKIQDCCQRYTSESKPDYSLLASLNRRRIMSSLLPGLSWFSRSSEKERGDTTHTRSGKGRRRTLSEPTPMDVDWEEGSRSKCSVCNGIYILFT